MPEPLPAGGSPEAATVTASRAPRIAIIVDDGGYGGSATEIILSLTPSLTLSILPNTPQGPRLARAAGALGFEIMLHMPMENLGADLRYEGQLDIDMSDADITRLTVDALAQVPGAIGVNNHTGSRFTRHPTALALFMDAIADEDLYFIDSLTTPDSRAHDMARAFGIPAAHRDLFLDHDDDPAMIRQRFRELIDRARAQGSAIGICHFRRNTARILREMLPELVEQGVELVHASELVL